MSYSKKKIIVAFQHIGQETSSWIIKSGLVYTVEYLGSIAPYRQTDVSYIYKRPFICPFLHATW